MKNVIGTAAASTAAPTPQEAQRLAELRFTVLDTVNASPYTTPQERATAALRVAACTNEQVLVKWYCNVLTLLSQRELAPPPAYATDSQRDTITCLLNHPRVSRQQKTNVLLHINRLTEQQAADLITKLQAQTGATAPAAKAAAQVARQLTLPHLTAYAPNPRPAAQPTNTVRPTSEADHAAAARFVPSGGLTIADFAALPAKSYSPLAPLHLPPHCAAWTYDPRTNHPRPAQAGEFICCLLYNN